MHGPRNAAIYGFVVDRNDEFIPIDEELERFVLKTIYDVGEVLLVR
jgi:hypothetical protein